MAGVKTFSPGGLLVETYRSLTPAADWEILPIPSIAVVCAGQYVGAGVDWKVGVGDQVEEEQILADGLRSSDVSLHSPIPGVIEAFREVVLADGTATQAAVIRLEGVFKKSGHPSQARDWTGMTPEKLIRFLWDFGVPLLGSSLEQPFNPAKLKSGIKTLVINAVQPEPYLTLGLRLIEDKAPEILTAVRILQRAFQVTQTWLAVDPDDPAGWKRQHFEGWDGIKLCLTRSKYPQAHKDLLLGTLGLTTKSSDEVLFVAPSTLLAVYQAVVMNRAYIEKPVVVSGDGVAFPGVYRARLGTPIAELIRAAGGIKPGATVVHGGPFRGSVAGDLSVPVTKATEAIVVLEQQQRDASSLECIHCGACASVCPVQIRPLHLYRALINEDFSTASAEGLAACLGCSLCSFVCPSRIPLKEIFVQAQGASLG